MSSPDGVSNWTNRGLAYDPKTNFVRYKDGTVNLSDKIGHAAVVLENGHVGFTFAVLPKAQKEGNNNCVRSA